MNKINIEKEINEYKNKINEIKIENEKNNLMYLNKMDNLE